MSRSIARTASLMLLGIVLSACSRFGPPGSDRVSTEEDRAALFDQILESTLDREAFSPAKNQRLQLDVAQAMIAVRGEFIEADTDEKLFYAIVKLSNTRKDQHLSVRPLSGGLWPRSWGELPHPWEPPPVLSAPLRFAADFGSPGERQFFVADLPENSPKDSPLSLVKVGDRLLEVNGRTLDEYVAAIEPYTAYSTVDGLWWNLAERLNEDSYRLPAELRSDRADYVLESGDGSQYRISLAYQNPDSIEWAGAAQPRYVGFDLAYRRKTFDLYVHTAGKVLLLDWFGFDPDLVADVDSMIRYAAQHQLLNHDIILDATRSGGGSRGAYALQHLSGSRFRTTFGNVRLSDVTNLFVSRRRQEAARRAHGVAKPGMLDDGTWLMEWIERDVEPGQREGREYSRDVPFKLVHAPMDSDGLLRPADVHFTGRLVLLLGPSGGSHLDQFASMVVDNKLGVTMGMPTAGFSNSWTWRELLIFPRGRQAVAYFSWSIGHTIRPNGEVLEGNPPAVDRFVPQTRANYVDYRDLLVRHALESLEFSK